MWMVDPKIMCPHHLIEEHYILHKELRHWKNMYHINGRILNNSIEPKSYKKRHDDLASEMLSRGMHHSCDIEQPDFSYLYEYEKKFVIDREKSLRTLLGICKSCRSRYRISHNSEEE